MERESPGYSPERLDYDRKTQRRSRRVGDHGDGRSPPPHDTELDSDEVRRLEASLGTLGHLNREVFIATCIDHLPYAGIARHTGLTEGQVERRIARAIITLDRALRGEPTRWWQRWRPPW